MVIPRHLPAANKQPGYRPNSEEEQASATRPPSGPRELRKPFRIAAEVSSKAARRVNSSIDSVRTNPYVKSTVGKLVSVERTAERIAWPYLQFLDPYFAAVKPYLLPIAVIALAVATPPILLISSIAAFVTSPVWLTIGFLTSFIWVPIVMFFAGLFIFALFIAAIRIGSSKRVQDFIRPFWMFISNTSLGRAIFYCRPS